jgi:hypothetical protein
MKIEVGEYVRTKYGITQFKAYETINGNKLLCMPVKDGSNGIFANIEDIIKSSPNIIDLIEVNDIVTYWVDTQSYNGWVQNFVDKELLKDMKEKFINEDIKSIVTHEQIENMEYRV